ncbi:MAG: cysteine synthase family protein, partial [Clostridia bacterium]|nr:cysteine synthase family protein [Clostridia bacterium]
MKNKIKFKNIFPLISNSPIVQIKYQFNGKCRKVYAKCEWFSLTGSVKDKVAYYMLKDAIKNNKINAGGHIVEVSSGNMGISLAAIGNLFDIHTTILMPKNMSEERKKLLKMYGAELVETKNFADAFKLCKKYEQNGYYCPHQFENESNIKAHFLLTGKEIFNSLKKHDYGSFVSGVGTSGTLTGVSKYLKSKHNITTIGVEPKNARILSNVPPFNKHKLQGLSDEILPKLYNKNYVDEIVQISDD